jgi:hypothetical protein
MAVCIIMTQKPGQIPISKKKHQAATIDKKKSMQI